MLDIIVNCTNHEIIVDFDDYINVIPPSGQVARVGLRQELVDIVENIPIYMLGPDSPIKGLPDPVEDTLYVVSALVSQHAQRTDVVCPNHSPGQCNRDHHGRIISVKSFLRYV